MRKALLFLAFLVHIFFSYSQNLDYAKSIVTKLASPELHGRGYTQQGNVFAAEYIASEFKQTGLIPFGKFYYQKFTIPVNTYPGALLVKINGETLKPAIDFLVESSSPGIKGTFNIVRVNRKELNTEEKLFKVIKNVGENFILINDTDKSKSEKENKQIDEYINYLKYSPQIPCKGIIMYTKNKLSWGNATYVNARPIIIINKELNIDNINSIDLVIENQFFKKYQTQNVVGYVKGTVVPDSFLVITAHYDHLGEMGNTTYFPGANDNASGVAMLLNLARYYSQNKPKYSIVFIALSAEEIGLLGAKEFVENPLINLKHIKFLINFDLAGTGDEGIKVVNGSIYRDKFDALTKINSENNLLPKVDIRGSACNSDHCMFYEKGVPCFYIYTQGGIKAYHDIYDKVETLPLTEFVDYCTLMIKFIDTF